MNRKPAIFGIVAAAVVVALSVLVFRWNDRQAESAASPGSRREEMAKEAASKSPALPMEKPAPEIEPAETGLNKPGAISLLGAVQAGQQAALSVRMPAKIEAVPAERGSAVREGELLVQLDDADFRSQLKTAEAGVEAAFALVRKAIAGRTAQRVKADADVQEAQSGLRMAQVKLRQATLARDAVRDDLEGERRVVKEGIRKAEAGLEQAQRTLRGLEELAKVGGVSKNDLEGARAQARVAQADLDTARAQAQRLEAGPEKDSTRTYRVALAQQDVEAAEAGVNQAKEGLQTAQDARRQLLTVTEEEVRSAQAALKQAKAGVLGAQTAIESMRVISPIAGIISSLEARVGETAQPGMTLVTVVSRSGLRVEALVTARQLPRLQVGQRGRVTVDTQPGKIFPVVVSDIAGVAEPDGRSFRVRFQFAQDDVPLRPGQTARIRLAHR